MLGKVKDVWESYYLFREIAGANKMNKLSNKELGYQLNAIEIYLRQLKMTDPHAMQTIKQLRELVKTRPRTKIAGK